MIEIIIERWTGPQGSEFRWSLWRDGRRLEMGGNFSDARTCESAAGEACLRLLGQAADRVTRL